MPKIEVWECGKTGSLFKTEHGWRRHLIEKQRQKTLHQRHLKRMAESDCVPEMRMCRTFEELARWIEENANRLYVRAAIRNHLSIYPTPKKQYLAWKPPEGFFVTNVAFERMIWKDRCSITHCAPAGKKTNWGGAPNLPRGYPGFHGSMIFCIGKHYTHSTNIFKGTGIHTGSGGSGGTWSRYEVTLFAEEWPLLTMHDKELYEHDNSSDRPPPHILRPTRVYEGGRVKA